MGKILDRPEFRGGATVGGVEVIDADGNVTANITDTLASGKIYVGNASNVSAEVAVSGNATLSNTGVLTVTGATGNFAVGGITTDTLAAVSGPGAIPITTGLAQVTTTGTGDAMTLANGVAGQRLSIIYVAEGAGGDTAVITPVTLAGGTTITLSALGDSVDLVYSATGGWYVLGLGGTAAVA